MTNPFVKDYFNVGGSFVVAECNKLDIFCIFGWVWWIAALRGAKRVVGGRLGDEVGSYGKIADVHNICVHAWPVGALEQAFLGFVDAIVTHKEGDFRISKDI
jgi:hypothetical protein